MELRKRVRRGLLLGSLLVLPLGIFFFSISLIDSLLVKGELTNVEGTSQTLGIVKLDEHGQAYLEFEYEGADYHCDIHINKSVYKQFEGDTCRKQIVFLRSDPKVNYIKSELNEVGGLNGMVVLLLIGFEVVSILIYRSLS